MVYTDGSRDSDGRVGGGWHALGNGAGSVEVSNIATVWDGEVAGIRQALRMAPDVDVLVLSDSTAALLAIKRAADRGRGHTRDLVEVVDEIGRRVTKSLSTQFRWVKAHVGVDGNEGADLMAKAGCRESLLPQLTEGGRRIAQHINHHVISQQPHIDNSWEQEQINWNDETNNPTPKSSRGKLQLWFPNRGYWDLAQNRGRLERLGDTKRPPCNITWWKQFRLSCISQHSERGTGCQRNWPFQFIFLQKNLGYARTHTELIN